MSCFRCFRKCCRKKSKFTHPGDHSAEPAVIRIEEDPDYDTPDKRSRFFAVLLPEKEVESTEKCPTVKTQINVGGEKLTEEKRDGENKENDSTLTDYRAILSRRMAVYEEAYKTSASKPVEVGVVFQVPRSKLIINPFDFDVDSKMKGKTYIASKVKVVEKRVKALDTDETVKNMMYELFQPVKETRHSWKTKR